MFKKGTVQKMSIYNRNFWCNKLFCFKKIYSLYYFKDRELMSKVERKREWTVPNIDVYLQRADNYLIEAKKIQKAISP